MKTKLNLILLFSFTLIISFQLLGQAFTDIKDVDILENQRIVVEKENPYLFDTLRILDVTKVDNKLSKITYLDEGIYHEAIVNDERKDMLLIATAIELPKERVPEIINDILTDEKYKNWNKDKILMMKTPYESWFYAIDMSNGDEHQRLYFDKLGAYKIPPY
jgi:hypothetical protein